MVAKPKSAADARLHEDFVIVARSDAYAEHGIHEITDRDMLMSKLVRICFSHYFTL